VDFNGADDVGQSRLKTLPAECEKIAETNYSASGGLSLTCGSWGTLGPIREELGRECSSCGIISKANRFSEQSLVFRLVKNRAAYSVTLILKRNLQFFLELRTRC